MIDFTQLSNSQLDKAFSVYWQSGISSEASLAGSEIAGRLSSPWSFIKGVFGSNTFPLYSAIMERANGVLPQADSAQVAVIDSAKAVAKKFELFGFSATAIIILLAVVYLVWRFKK